MLIILALKAGRRTASLVTFTVGSLQDCLQKKVELDIQRHGVFI